jgi:lycopene cyclase domain-containing protein
MKTYSYLLINFFSILFPFLFSFHPKINFRKKFVVLFPSILITAAFFILWDIVFTKQGVWGFNPNYITGVYFFNLPIEEVLFFIFIPYASIFIYESLIVFEVKDYFKNAENKIIYLLIILFSCMTGLYYDKLYTSFTFGFNAVFLIMYLLFIKQKFLSRFYFAYLIVLIPFFILKGILTGTGVDEPIVWYNNAENLGIRILTIPIEDAFYGMLMLLMSITFYEMKLKRF